MGRKGDVMKFILLLIVLVIVPSTLFAGTSVLSDKCSGGIKSQGAYVIKSVTKTKGSPNSETETIKTKHNYKPGICYRINDAKFVFRIDDHHAIYKVLGDDYYSNYLLAVDFGRDKAELTRFSGVVKSFGGYKYEDDRGIPKSIPAASVVK